MEMPGWVPEKHQPVGGKPNFLAGDGAMRQADALPPAKRKRGKPEAGWQKTVIDAAHAFGWQVAHFRAVPVLRGQKVIYQTPVAADAEGFPDLILCRVGRMICAELKSDDKGVTKTEQKRWLSLMATVPGVEVHIWQPRDWETVKRVLA